MTKTRSRTAALALLTLLASGAALANRSSDRP